MEGKLHLELDIVRTKIVNRKSPSYILFMILYIAALFLVFTPNIYGLDKNTIPLYLKILSLLIYLFGLFLIFKDNWTKPEILGKLRIFIDRIIINRNSSNQIIQISDLRKIEFDYFGYSNIFSNKPFGNGNYIKIEQNDDEKYEYEIRIKTKDEKEKLKKIFNNLTSKDVKVTINLITKLRSF